jgi:serine/threonine-protein kinase
VKADVTTLDGVTAGARTTAAADTSGVGGDRYVLGDVLGEGGMGIVRRCVDRKIGRGVALKLLRRLGDEDHDRFVREARVQAELDHPGVVPVYDLCEVRGQAYFTMRTVNGVTLDTVIDRLLAGEAQAIAEYTPHRLLAAFAQICLTVDYAHARGVLHRDLKPSNVMLGDFGEIYVLDWGLAKLRSEPSDPEQPEVRSPSAVGAVDTDVSVAMGTPGYMAPEQAAALPLDARTDVFALGALLFEILSLQQLVSAEEGRAMLAREEVVYDARPSVRAPHVGVPPELDAICVRATAAAPDDRFPTARALHDALQASLTVDQHDAHRQRLAADHRERARAAAARPDTATGAARVEALEELGRALGLAPEDTDARRLLAHLLLTPPKIVPDEVEKEATARAYARVRRGQLTGAIINTAPWVTILPLIAYLVGTRSILDVALVAAAWAAAGASILALRWFRIYDSPINYGALFAMVAVGTTSLIMGPYFIVPALAAALVIGYVLLGTRRQERATVVMGCAAIVVPTYLAWRGTLDVYEFLPDRIAVHGALYLTPSAFYLGLTAAHLVILVFAALFAARFRDTLEVGVLRNELLAWQLATLIPTDDGPGASGALLPPVATDPRGGARQTRVDRDSVPASGGARATPEDRYERVRLLDRGHGTQVWQCRDRKLGRDVALTLLLPGQPEEVVVGFAAEAGLRARLEHPAILPIYEIGTDDAGAVRFFTTKLAAGTRLDEVLAVRASSHGDAAHGLLALLGKVCLAVEYAHGRGVRHGALQPSMVTVGASGEVYVNGWTPARSEHVARSADVVGLGAILNAILATLPHPPPELEMIRDAATSSDPGKRTESARHVHEALEEYLSGERDAALRRGLSAGHRERASRAAARMVSGDADASTRIEALREVGRAIVLAPDAESFALLLRLLTEPPAKAPLEVEARIEAMRIERARGPALAAGLFGGLWLVLYAALALLIGVREPLAAIAVAIAWLATVVAMLASVRRGASSTWSMIALMVATAMTSALCGPFHVVPVLAVVSGMGHVLTGERWLRAPTVVLSALAVLVPTVLAGTHIHGVYELDEVYLTLRGALDAPSPLAACLVLTGANLIGLLFAAEYAARLRNTLESVELDGLLFSWQLSKLVPMKAG